MLDMYGVELEIGDTVQVFGIYENIVTKNWLVTKYLGCELYDGNTVAIVEGTSKRFDCQNIIYLNNIWGDRNANRTNTNEI